MSELDWWDANDTVRTNAEGKFPISGTLKYCSDSTIKPKPLKRLPCRYFNEDDIAPARSTGGPFLNLATRVTEMTQQRVCLQPSNGTCPHVWVTSNYYAAYFVAGAEDFIMMVDHQCFSPSTHINGASTSYNAPRLYFGDDSHYLSPVMGTGFYNLASRDLITVGTLLAAAGVDDLDEITGGLFSDNTTYRYTGITLLLNIWYSNFAPWSFLPGNVRYDYRVLTGTPYQTYHTTYPTAGVDPNMTRLWQNRHGINIQVQQEGKLYSFDLFSCTVFLASTIALQTLAIFLVDSFAQYLTPGPTRTKYRDAKYDKLFFENSPSQIQQGRGAHPDDDQHGGSNQYTPLRTE